MTRTAGPRREPRGSILTIGYVSPAAFERQAQAACESVPRVAGVAFTGVLQSGPPNDRRSSSIL
jgi:hypothetical protein